MTIVIDDPLISAMTIERVLPLHESSRRLRKLYPQCPRVYGVAVLGDVSVRRWWPLSSALTTDRMKTMFDAATIDMDSRSAAKQLAATLVHTVIGRVVALVVLEARAWDTGLENLWVHVDSDGVIDWAAVVDPTVRVLPDDPCAGDGVGGGVVRLPSEAALTTWVAHRCHRTLEPLFTKLHMVSGGALPDRGDVAHRRVDGGGMCDPGAAAGRRRRAGGDAPRSGGTRRAGRLRPAGSRRASGATTDAGDPLRH